MIVDAEHHFVAQRFARLVEHPVRSAPIDSRGSKMFLAVLPEREEADRLSSPAAHQLLGSFDRSIALGLVAGRGEGRNVVALLAAQQLVDRHTERLALDVVERDVDAPKSPPAGRGRLRNTGCDTFPARSRRCAIGSRPMRNSR